MKAELYSNFYKNPSIMSANNNNQTHQAEGHTEEQIRFLIFINTLMLTKTSLKGIDENPFVHISQKDIEKRFFPWPKFNRDKEIKKLINDGSLEKKQELNPKTGHRMDIYRSLRPCGVDVSLIQREVPVYGNTQRFMLECLLHTNLETDSLRTPYFDFFLKNKDEFPHLFFKFDDFSHRLHTPVTSLNKEYRKNILLYGMPVCSLDVAQMQPQILGKILKSMLGVNQFSTWMDNGVDVYQMIAAAYKLPTRAEGKTRLFTIMFGMPNDNLSNVFGNVEWVTWVNSYKRTINTGNPYTHKLHNNLAWLLQTTEVRIMKEVWKRMANAGIHFLTVHDEILCRRQDKEAAIKIFTEVLKTEFVNYQLNVN